MFDRRGSALIESLLMALVLTLSFPLISSCIQTLASLDADGVIDQKINQLYQLRNELLFADEIQVQPDRVSYFTDQPVELSLHGDKIIRTPGTLIYFADVQSCSFYTDQRMIMMSAIIDGKSEEWMIGYVR